MEIHRFEAAWLGVSILLIVGFIATVTYGALGAGVTMVSDSGGTVDPSLIAGGDYEQTDAFREPGVYAGDGENHYEAYVVAKQFAFEPGTTPTYEPIRVPAGSTVTFYVTSADVTHGFNLAGTNVNVMAIPGQVAEITVEFDDPGTYGIVCHEYCGQAHHSMAGQVKVVKQSNFELGGES